MESCLSESSAPSGFHKGDARILRCLSELVLVTALVGDTAENSG